MTDFFTALFTNSMLSRGALAGVLVSLCASLLGVSLVLKRYSMIGDGLSHVAFGTLSVAAAANIAPLYLTIPIVTIAAFLLLIISESSKIKGDSAIALIASTALSAGVIVSAVGGVNIDVNSYMFGSILLVSKSDFKVCILLSAVVLTMFSFFYNAIFCITYDETFSKASGIKVFAYKGAIAFMTALTVVIGMKIMGTLMISSLIIFPSLSSMRVFKSFRGVVISSGIVSVTCFLAGLYFSYLLDLPTGASVVAANAAAFLIFFAYGKISR